MAEISSLEDLKKMREQASLALKTRSGDAKVIIRASMGTVGIAAGARDVIKALINELEKLNFNDVEILGSSSLGLDKEEPVVSVERDGATTTYGKVSVEMARKIADRHVVNGQAIGEWVIARNKK